MKHFPGVRIFPPDDKGVPGPLFFMAGSSLLTIAPAAAVNSGGIVEGFLWAATPADAPESPPIGGRENRTVRAKTVAGVHDKVITVIQQVSAPCVKPENG